jgi:uncharacterized protein
MGVRSQTLKYPALARPQDSASLDSCAVEEYALSGRQLRGEPLRCPVDGSRLVQTERSEILIDACPECRGVWLDRGELDRILVKERQWLSSDPEEEFFGEVEGRRRPRERSGYDDRDRNDDERGSRRKKRRGGFLEDLLEGFGD